MSDAPSVDPDAALDPDEEAALRRHYGLDDAQPAEEPGAAAATPTDDPVPPDRPADRAGAVRANGPYDAPRDTDRTDALHHTDRADAVSDTAEPTPAHTGGPVEMIRSEEEVVAGTTAPRPTERVRLRKVRVTENVTRTVPVRREEVRLEHEPPPAGRIESVEDVEDDRPA